eukprot:5801528-Lingulodinium_polyedra.AAC.1
MMRPWARARGNAETSPENCRLRGLSWKPRKTGAVAATGGRPALLSARFWNTVALDGGRAHDGAKPQPKTAARVGYREGP